jgi:hypothetical protein
MRENFLFERQIDYTKLLNKNSLIHYKMLVKIYLEIEGIWQVYYINLSGRTRLVLTFC